MEAPLIKTQQNILDLSPHHREYSLTRPLLDLHASEQFIKQRLLSGDQHSDHRDKQLKGEVHYRSPILPSTVSVPILGFHSPRHAQLCTQSHEHDSTMNTVLAGKTTVTKIVQEHWYLSPSSEQAFTNRIVLVKKTKAKSRVLRKNSDVRFN